MNAHDDLYEPIGATELTAGLRPVTVLYTMPRSVYLGMPGVDCWDEIRDARTWPGGTPVVAHPPCRLWGKLRHLSTADVSEKDLARHSVAAVRRWGGVLEHPAQSKLWEDQRMPVPGDGRLREYTVSIAQHHFGHQALKPTWFFIVGVDWQKVPVFQLSLDFHTHQISGSFRSSSKRGMSRRRRAATPPALASWLVAVARLVNLQEAAP